MTQECKVLNLFSSFSFFSFLQVFRGCGQPKLLEKGRVSRDVSGKFDARFTMTESTGTNLQKLVNIYYINNLIVILKLTDVQQRQLAKLHRLHD